MSIKILFLIPTLDKGGAENVLINLVNNMDSEMFDITVQTLFDLNSQKALLSEKIHYKSFFTRQFKGNSRLLARISPKFLYNILIKERYDIVVSYLEGPTTHILSGCRFRETKKVSWIHVELNDDRSFSAGFKSKEKALEAYKKYDRIIYVAKTVKTQFEKTAGCSFPQGKVLYNTIDSNQIICDAEEPISDVVFNKNEKNIISVGRIVNAKGYDRLAHVHKRLIDEGIKHHIYILGSGNQQAEIEQYISKYNLTDTFTFLGFRNNPYKYMAKADLFICSSRREGFSTAVTESLVVGTPVVSTNCSGAYELLGANNEYGIVVENSEEGIYQGLKRMILDDSILKMYKEKALQRAKVFEINKTVSQVEKMLLDLV